MTLQIYIVNENDVDGDGGDDNVDENCATDDDGDCQMLVMTVSMMMIF